ncbi:MAG: YdbL family protein [Deltaproteobacteria bacterium]|nr:YdbL family protein [Deltaproteobacteria bacterium]
MKIRRLQIIIFTLIITSLLLSTGSLAGSLKEEMRARQPKINKLKADGLIGENNHGYLKYRGNEEPEKRLIDAENQDRDAVYKAIARQQNTDSENVGRRRATQIADRAPAGTWLQNNQDKWYRKQ